MFIVCGQTADFFPVNFLGIIGVSWSEPHPNHLYEKITVPMYVYVIVCSNTSSMCVCAHHNIAHVQACCYAHV